MRRFNSSDHTSVCRSPCHLRSFQDRPDPLPSYHYISAHQKTPAGARSKKAQQFATSLSLINRRVNIRVERRLGSARLLLIELPYTVGLAVVDALTNLLRHLLEQRV
jgi:hypothetical protein